MVNARVWFEEEKAKGMKERTAPTDIVGRMIEKEKLAAALKARTNG
jgi:hypothetical protein